MLVRLKVKLAEMVNGLDLSHCVEGDVIDVGNRDGEMLIAERWAEPASAEEMVTCTPKRVEREVAADEGMPGWRKASAELPMQNLFKVVQPGSPEHEP